MTKKSTKRRAWSLLSTVVLLLLLGTNLLNAQTLANYTYATGTNGSLEDLSTGSTNIMIGNNDDAAGTVTPIGFDFLFMGLRYSHFSANSNGQMMLHTSSSATAAASQQSTPTAGLAILAPMTGDNEVNNGIRIKMLGTAPNRKLVIEWNQYYVNYVNLTNAGNMQVWLEETTGIVTYVYGEIYNSASASQTRSIYIASSNTATTTGSVTLSATPTFALGTTLAVNTIAAGSGLTTGSPLIADLGSSSNTTRRFFSWTPAATVPANPITLSFTSVNFTTTTVNWVDNSTNELGFSVIRATDAGFTQNLVVTNVGTTTGAGTGTAYTSAQTGLSAGTTYFYKVTANTEGVGSSGLTGNQSTTAGATYYWVGASGSTWASAANWNTNPAGGGSTRTSVLTTDVLIIDGAGTTAGAATTISVDATSFSIGQLKVTSNTALTLASSATTTRTITITGGGGDDFVIEAGSSIIQNNATNAIGFAFSGNTNTGNIAGTYTIGGSTSNVFSSTGGTGTLVTIASTGIINNNTVGTGSYFTGSVATMSFAGGSAYNVNGATTGVTVPLATWATTATLTFNSLTTATALTNNNQSFGNIVFNCSSLTSTFSVWTTSTTAVVKGDLTITAAGATAGTGIFRALTSGTVNINGNLVVTQGRFQSASGTGTLIVSGNTTNSANGIIDINAGTFSQRGTTFTNNGALTGVAATSTLQFLSFTNTPQTFAGTGTVTTNVGVISLQNSGGLTISHSNQIPILRANLFLGTITNSNKITIGTGAALATTVQIGAAGILTPGGSFDANPTLNLGTGAYNVIYAQESVARTSGFEIPASRVISALTVTNSNGLTISGGNLATGTLTFNALSGGNITTNASNLLTVTGTTTGSIVRTLATAYVNGPMAITLPASLATGTTYILPIGKSAINAFELVNPITNAGGTVTIRAEVVDSGSTGTPSGLIGTLSTSRYWTASITAGAANFTSSLIKLNSVPAGADAIASSTTLTGSYTNVGGTTITSTGTSLTSTAPEATTLDGFYSMGNKAAATLSALAITPSGNLCTHALRTVTVTATPGGGAVTGVALNYFVNGVAQTPIAMTNTSGNDWTGDIPTVTPVNSVVTWNVTATDANSLTRVQTGTSYNDEPFVGLTTSITSSIATACVGSSATLTANATKAIATVGAGFTNSSTVGITFLPAGFGGAKTQYLIRAAELTTAGLTRGRIYSLGFEPTTAGQTYQQFSVSMANTSSTAMNTNFTTTGLTQVYAGTLANDGFLPVAGVVNTLAFGTGTGSSSSFAWDGVSNVLVSISWSSLPTASTAVVTTIKSDVSTGSFVSSAYYQVNNASIATVLAQPTATATTTSRPRFIFNGRPTIT
ncbi:MAG: beta strand repeat-containing protein, partial [Bacteroidia bacterium]